jgi:hypothetical protein
MLAMGKKCWVVSMKKWQFKNQPQEVAGFLLPIQPSLETMPRLATTHGLQMRIVQPLLETSPRTSHIDLTRLIKVRGWAKSQVFWCNTHNIQMGVRMAKLATIQLVQPVGARST